MVDVYRRIHVGELWSLIMKQTPVGPPPNLQPEPLPALLQNPVSPAAGSVS